MAKTSAQGSLIAGTDHEISVQQVAFNAPPEAELSLQEMLVAPLQFLLLGWLMTCVMIMLTVWMIFALKRLFSHHLTHNLLATQPQESPCPHCRFFSPNAYLRCAVHPSVVLTDQAIDCSNFWALDCDKFAE